MNLDTLRGIFPTGILSADNKAFATRTATNSTVVATTTDYATWTLTTAGTSAAAANQAEVLSALSLTEEAAAGAASAADIGTTAVGTVVATETAPGVHRTLLTLTNVAQAILNTNQYIGTKIYTFPAGRILVLGVIATIAQKTTSILLDTLNASSAGVLSIGTATASNTTLDSTMADLLPSTAFTSSATINVAGTAVSGALAASAQFDGTSTAVPVYINSAYVADGLIDADATQTLTGTVVITWVSLGDY